MPKGSPHKWSIPQKRPLTVRMENLANPRLYLLIPSPHHLPPLKNPFPEKKPVDFEVPMRLFPSFLVMFRIFFSGPYAVNPMGSMRAGGSHLAARVLAAGERIRARLAHWRHAPSPGETEVGCSDGFSGMPQSRSTQKLDWEPNRRAGCGANRKHRLLASLCALYSQ